MKSKRKEVNKLKNKGEVVEQEQESEQILKRTTGVKPFHLSKVRMQKRGSEQVVSKKGSGQMVLQKYPATKSGSAENQDVYLDLIIKKKLLVDGQKNGKPDTQRRSVVLKDNRQQNQNRDQPVLLQSLNTEQVRLNNVTQQQLQPFKSQDFANTKQLKHRRSKSKCECCHQIHGHSTQAIICKTNEYNMFHRSSSAQGSNSETSLQKDRIDPKAELRNIIQKTSKSPFSFTNLKWRSKSQLAIVDKWKQKYNHVNEISNSLTKKQKGSLINYQLAGSKRQSKEKLQKQRLSLPVLTKVNQLQRQTKQSQLLKENSIQQLIVQKKAEIQKPQIKVQKEPTKTITQVGKKKTANSQVESSKQSNIVIREMYSKQYLQIMLTEQKKVVKIQRENSKDKMEQVLNMIKQEKHKNKKSKSLRSKFPEIRVSTFYSIKQNDEEKKKLRLVNLQKMVISSKSKPAKKVYFEKSLEQIPERWEYGESRDQSREEVQQYVSIKKQELVSLQQKRLSELAQFSEEQKKLRVENIQKMQEILINKDG